MERVHITGSYLSPYVRKVLVVLHLQNVAYTIDPITPFFGSEAFTLISPLRRIPVLQHQPGNVSLCDSTVISEYLNDVALQQQQNRSASAAASFDLSWPSPRYPVYPVSSARARAHCRWVEEYCDSYLGEVVVWRLWNEMFVKPALNHTKRDRVAVQHIVTTELTPAFRQLEDMVPRAAAASSSSSSSSDDLFFFEHRPTMADISIGAFFRNFVLCSQSVDTVAFPHLSRYVSFVHSRIPAFHTAWLLVKYELLMLRTPITQQRSVLQEAGAPISEHTVGTDQPQASIMLSIKSKL